jgi:hypothetical protein
MIREVLAAEVQDRQAHFMVEFARAAAYSNGMFSARAIFAEVMAGRAMILETSGGIAVIDSMQAEAGLFVRIAAMAGNGISEWIAEVDHAAMALAKTLKAVGVISLGLPNSGAETIERGYTITHIAGFKAVELSPDGDAVAWPIVDPMSSIDKGGSTPFENQVTTSKALH